MAEEGHDSESPALPGASFEHVKRHIFAPDVSDWLTENIERPSRVGAAYRPGTQQALRSVGPGRSHCPQLGEQPDSRGGVTGPQS